VIAELGHYALGLALVVALVQALLPLWGAQMAAAASQGTNGARGQVASAAPSAMALAVPAARLQLALVALAYAALTSAFLADDFSVALVAGHSHTALPVAYKVAAVWGNHEGSVLLWALVLAAWSAAVSWRSAALDAITRARVLGVMGLVSVGLMLFILGVSNPFTRLLPGAAEGRDLNPLLQDPGMALHPPLLYMGYVGLAVPFAFAVAALLAGRLDAAWARWTRPWALTAWCFLTLGIALGSFWAYYELGWGGWWFWDPVENASLMPWLIATALIHALAATEQRGALQAWTALLSLSGFALSLLGTFIVRSGVLSSVHAFATDPERGVFILGLLVLVVGGSLMLFAMRAHTLGAGRHFAPLSRESLVLAGNLLLAVSAAAVLLGTLYPLALDALGVGKLSVGPPYFEAVFVPVLAPALFLMGVGPLARWGEAPVGTLMRRLRWAAAAAGLGALAALVGAGGPPGLALAWGLATWVVASGLVTVGDRLRHAPPGLGSRLRRLGGATGGMLLAHLGVAVFVAGVGTVRSLHSEHDLRMTVGDEARVGGHVFRLEGLSQRQGPNYLALSATLVVTREGQPVAVLRPERRQYISSRMPMTEVAIDRGLTRDLYVALGDALPPDALGIRIHYKPLVNWIWGGCLLMALGGLLAATDRRYRVATAARTRPHGALEPAA
jgi:cytochrome c-type biogenesis protein CcmF